MKITINAVKFKPDAKLEEFVNDKVQKFGKNISNLIGCDVTLKVDKPESDNNKIAELHMHLPGHTLFSSKQANSFEEATMLALDAIKPQILKIKDKPKNNTSREELSNLLTEDE